MLFSQWIKIVSSFGSSPDHRNVPVLEWYRYKVPNTKVIRNFVIRNFDIRNLVPAPLE